MAKKKQAENETLAPAEGAVCEPEDRPAVALSELAEEVHVFLAKRSELAQKLALEIEATEKKLAELKRTAALLLSENGVSAPAEKEKQERKPKKPSSSKMPKSTAHTANEDRPLLDQAAETVSPQPAAAETNGRAHDPDAPATGDHG